MTPVEASCDCGWKGQPDKELPGMCLSCKGWLRCPLGCGKEGEEHGRHFYHERMCSYHYGPCEKPVWCECPGVLGKPSEKEALENLLDTVTNESEDDEEPGPERNCRADDVTE